MDRREKKDKRNRENSFFSDVWIAVGAAAVIVIIIIVMLLVL